MPDPKKYDSQDDWMAACVPVRIDEGDKQDRAVAACLNIWRNRNKEIEMEEEVKDKIWNAFTSWESLMSLFKEKPMKTVGGVKYPSSDFLVVEDSQSPSTWHLQVKKHGKPDHNLMGAAKAALTSPGGHRGNPYQGPNKQEAISKLKRLYNSEGMEWSDTKENAHPFMVWKEGKQYRWLSVYSNKWRDEDNPPEILASQAHRDFVKSVDEGDWPYPEVWLWHMPGTKFGVADFVAYDETGFALASGTVDKGKEHVAEALAKDENLATSHGMPVKEIERDTADSTIITRYRTIEISPLPREAAANKYGTGYKILEEVKEMAIPESKRPWLEEKLGADGLKELEATLEDKAKELEDLDIESKEEAAEESYQEPEQEEVEDAGDAEPKEAEAAPEYVTAEQVAEAVGMAIKPLAEAIAALRPNVEALSQQVSEQSEEIKALKKDEEAKLKETIANTPAASLFERIQSVIGSEETLVDGRTSLAKSGPKETMDDSQGPTKVGLINQLMAQAWGQQ